MYITTQFLNDRMKCDYLDYNTQPASDMLYKCVQDKNRGYDMNCERYNSDRDLDRGADNISIKRGVTEGKGNLTAADVGIEGFTDKIFITDDGPGESNVPFDECPVGYTLRDGFCVQVCQACQYKDNQRSRQFNEGDPCFPEGVYNGLTNEGNVKCTCGERNQFCSGNFVNNIFSTDGMFIFNNSIKNSIGNTNIVDNLFLIDQL